MCMMVMAIASTVASVASAAAQGSAASKQAKAAAKQAVTSANYEMADLENTRMEARDAALRELQAADIEAKRLQSQVDASLGETGLEGNSINAVRRDLEAQAARQREGIREDYQRESEAITTNKDRAAKGMTSRVTAIKSSQKYNNISTGLQIGSSLLDGATKLSKTSGK